MMLAAAPAQASIFDVFGMTARATAMGGASGASASDHAAIYYNPAALTVRKKTHLGVTIQMVAPQLELSQGPTSSRAAQLPSANVGFTTGVVFPLGGKIEDRVAVGVAVFLPLVQATRYQAIDPATPQFFMYQSQPDTLVIAGGVAFEVADWLSVGVGTQLLASFFGKFDIAVALGNRRVTQRHQYGELFGEPAPVVGVLVRPIDGLSLGVTYRDDISLDFNLPIDFMIEEIGLLSILAKGRGLYSPDQLNGAVAYTTPVGGSRLTTALDVTWERWSAAPSPALHVEATFDTSGFDPDNPVQFLDLETIDPKLGAKDIVVPHVGAELALNDAVSLQAGYFYRPSPIPDQTGYSSYADCAAHVASLGGSLTWSDPLEVHENPVSLDVFVQLTALAARDAHKDTAQDVEGVGDWTARGMVWNLGLEWRHDF